MADTTTSPPAKLPRAPKRPVDRSSYAGREQTYAKHFFLNNYLSALAFKVLQANKNSPHFVYVDGFSGPWNSQSEDYRDTSFGIALNLLTGVVNDLGTKGIRPRIRAFFVESDARARRELETAVQAYPRIETRVLPGPFEDRVGDIAAAVGDGFLFTFLDPTGWTGMALEKVKPLLLHRPGEVLVNLMTYSVVRHITYDPVRRGFDELLGGPGWEAEFETLTAKLGEREEAFRLLYLSRLKSVCGFKYATTTRAPAVRVVVRWPEKVCDFWRGVTEGGLGLLG